MQPHGEPAVSLLLEELVRALVPDLDGAGAVLAGRDHALEVGVVEWVVLDVHRKMPLPLAKRNALRDCPARESTVALEPKVVVEPPGGVALNDETRSLGCAGSPSERLRRLPSAALAMVLVEAHLWIVARSATVSLPRGCKKDFLPAQTAFEAGDKPVEDGENPPKGLGGRQNAHHAVLGPPLAPALVRIECIDLLECGENSLLEQLRRCIGIGVCAAFGLRDDRVDDAQLEAVSGVRLERSRRLPRLARRPATGSPRSPRARSRSRWRSPASARGRRPRWRRRLRTRPRR